MVYNLINDITYYIILSISLLLLILFAYWFVIGLFGFGEPKPLPSHKLTKRFLLLVPAHNEEAVIEPLVNNLLNLDYPKELYDVLVIADNCNDNTANIVRNAGANAIEHTSLPGELKGKPYAILYALEQLGEDLVQKYDAVSIFDADNLVSKNYLIEMNKHLHEGHKLIQCYLDSKNPNDNLISLGYATAYYYMNRSWQLGKARLGLGNAVGGTGFTVDTKLLKEIGWSARSLTEDLEFTMQCLLHGEKAYWSHEAKIYDEKPVSFKASCIQRLRWARGHWDVCFKYSFQLLKRAIIKRDFAALDGFLYLINPGKIVVGTMLDIIMLSIALSVIFFNGTYVLTVYVPLYVFIVFLLFQGIYIFYSIKKDTNVKVNFFKAIWALFLTNVTYIPLFAWALITYKRKEWNPTVHSRNINHEELI